MKHLKKIAYVLVVVIILILSFTIYTNASKNSEQDLKEKTVSEIRYIESKLLDLFNTLNNLETRNYNISVTEMSKESTEKQSEESSKESSQGSSSGSSSGESSGQSSGGSNDKQDNKKFELKLEGVLTNTNDINWDSISSEIEMLYTSIPSMTMDLYQYDINQEDILSFNKEFDQLAVNSKEKKKEEVLAQLSKLYNQLPKFLEHISEDELYKTQVSTKNEVLKGYSKLDSGNWEEISNDIKNAINTFSKLLTNTTIDVSKQYSINKSYIMLNELQNAVNIKDESVFLIKYKNLLEEIDNL